MRPLKTVPELRDDLDFATFTTALAANVRTLKAKGDQTLTFGPSKISAGAYAAALESLLAAAEADPSGEKFRALLREKFDAFEVYGADTWGEVFLTSYFEPVIEGARKPGGRFRQPLYGYPRDMIEIDLSSFADARPGIGRGVLRGRMVNGRGRVVAYPDRGAIEAGGLREAPVLAYVDPIDGFFLEIQGSGVVRLEGGTELKVGYAGQNGYPYVPIGRFLLDKIPKEKMSQQAIEAHLRSLPEGEQRALLNRNPSYVFFKPVPRAGVTYFGTEVTGGRTIATDASLFPKGALAFLEFEKPRFERDDSTEAMAWDKTSRFVFDQDTGGAIKGPGRVDLFWGRGAPAKQSAGVMRGKGRLVYFVPKAG